MMYVQRKKFSAIVLMNDHGSDIKLEEDNVLEITMAETGEVIEECVLVKIQTKELIVHIPEERFDRLISFTDIEDIKVVG